MEITPIYCHPYLGIHARNRFREKTAYFFIVKSVISAGHGTAPVLKHREVEDPRCFRRNHRTTDKGLPRFEFNCRQRTGDFLRLRCLTTHGARDLPFFFLSFRSSLEAIDSWSTHHSVHVEGHATCYLQDTSVHPVSFSTSSFRFFFLLFVFLFVPLRGLLDSLRSRRR